MKIGILTFHWAANHGAVLQTYALSTYLKEKYDADVEIINYYPQNHEYSAINVLKKCRPKTVLSKFKDIKKEKNISPFRKNLKLTQRYYTNDELIISNLDYDILITGSDQIWNPSFLRYGERKQTPVYFLNFGVEAVKKISVSASFGCEVYPIDCQKIVKPLLEQFTAISVREKTGKDILSDMGISSIVTADPTALLTNEQYLKLCNSKSYEKNNKVSKMILRKQNKNVKKLIYEVCKAYSSEEVADIQYLSIPDWLTAIRDSRMVVTNSFHCVMMCLKLHTPFVVILENGTMAGMNDRFVTLLDMFGLRNRIINNVNEIDESFMDINFDIVDKVMEQYTKTLKNFLLEHIE